MYTINSKTVIKQGTLYSLAHLIVWHTKESDLLIKFQRFKAFINLQHTHWYNYKMKKKKIKPTHHLKKIDVDMIFCNRKLLQKMILKWQESTEDMNTIYSLSPI